MRSWRPKTGILHTDLVSRRSPTAVKAFERKRPSRKRFPVHRPHQRVVIATHTNCACCESAKLSKLGEDGIETRKVTRRFGGGNLCKMRYEPGFSATDKYRVREQAHARKFFSRTSDASFTAGSLPDLAKPTPSPYGTDTTSRFIDVPSAACVFNSSLFHLKQTEYIFPLSKPFTNPLVQPNAVGVDQSVGTRK